jgi:hypothetical protein
MGAEQYVDIGRGKDMVDAFWKVVEASLYENGHGGYTGTIAEKGSVREIKVTVPQEYIDKHDGDLVWASEDYAWELINEDGFWDDKWGPSAGFHIKDDIYCFFGLASS